jgi:23S rRNA (uracil1939-C5)-methyltransferase
VLHRDDRLVVVSKAPHEPTTPQGEHERPLLERVRRMSGCESAIVVHRLDIGTSGACLFATSPEHVPHLSAALASSEKEYLALVRGITRDRGTIRRPLRERGRSREACTRYVRCEVVGGQSLLSVRPDQGYKHQVRRHLASIGHPVIGDERYGHAATNQFFSRKHLLDRPFLHCARITWSHEGHEIDVAAPLAGDLAGVLTSCRGRKQS